MSIKSVGQRLFPNVTPPSTPEPLGPEKGAQRITNVSCQAVSPPQDEPASLEMRTFARAPEEPPSCKATDHEIMEYLRLPTEDPRAFHDWS